MPISDPQNYKEGHFREVYEAIYVPACLDAGFKAFRADDNCEANLIHLDILTHLINAPMAICDLSTHNANVFFELGLRQAFDKPTVLTQEVGTPKVFDISSFRYAEYRASLRWNEVPEDRLKVASAITATQLASQGGTLVNSLVLLGSV